MSYGEGGFALGSLEKLFGNITLCKKVFIIDTPERHFPAPTRIGRFIQRPRFQDLDISQQRNKVK
jgi:hypothetical protein